MGVDGYGYIHALRTGMLRLERMNSFGMTLGLTLTHEHSNQSIHPSIAPVSEKLQLLILYVHMYVWYVCCACQASLTAG